MSQSEDRQLRTGGDPRALANYAALREELAKFTHPARPDINWQKAEQLCLSLFQQNGADLQTVAWYTLVRTQLQGVQGMNEGLAILETLVSKQWACFWPEPLHARMEILTVLSQRLQQRLRNFTLNDTESTHAYQAEQYLNTLAEALRQSGTPRTNPFNELRSFIHNTVARQESAIVTRDERSDVQPPEVESVTPLPSLAQQPWVYVIKAEPEESEPLVVQRGSWKTFSTGMLTGLLVGSLGVWGWQAMNRKPAPLALVAPLPRVFSEPALALLKATQNDALVQQAPGLIAETTQQLEQLNTLSPVWTQEYGFALARQANLLWPESPEAQHLNEKWEHRLSTNATPLEVLSGWHQTMEQLQQLTHRLDGLDEKHGHYMTVSELKSVTFSMTQSMERSLPLEEQLYRMTLAQDKTQPIQALQNQIDINFTQLLNRYALIKRTVPASGM